MTIQEKNINIQWLLGHGYTPTEAAEVLGVTASHLRRVLKGAPDRGNALKVRIRRLPRKKLTSLRRMVSGYGGAAGARRPQGPAHGHPASHGKATR